MCHGFTMALMNLREKGCGEHASLVELLRAPQE